MLPGDGATCSGVSPNQVLTSSRHLALAIARTSGLVNSRGFSGRSSGLILLKPQLGWFFTRNVCGSLTPLGPRATQVFLRGRTPKDSEGMTQELIVKRHVGVDPPVDRHLREIPSVRLPPAFLDRLVRALPVVRLIRLLVHALIMPYCRRIVKARIGHPQKETMKAE